MRYETLLAFVVAVTACNNDHSLGLLDPEETSQPAQPDALAALPTDAGTPTEPDARVLGPLGPVESWTGYIENYQFQSGSDAIKLSLAYDPEGQVAGTVLFGNGTPPPPATDPNVAYPVGFGYGSSLYLPTEGFTFSVVTGSLAANRLRFSVNAMDPWADWCALQPAPADGSGGCLPNWSAGGGPEGCWQNSPSGAKVMVDCGKLTLCTLYEVCACSPSGCHAGDLPVSFDVFVDNGSASGSVMGGMIGGNVHFTENP
jgi:hypothetical protein